MEDSEVLSGDALKNEIHWWLTKMIVKRETLHQIVSQFTAGAVWLQSILFFVCQPTREYHYWYLDTDECTSPGSENITVWSDMSYFSLFLSDGSVSVFRRPHDRNNLKSVSWVLWKLVVVLKFLQRLLVKLESIFCNIHRFCLRSFPPLSLLCFLVVMVLFHQDKPLLLQHCTHYMQVTWNWLQEHMAKFHWFRCLPNLNPIQHEWDILQTLLNFFPATPNKHNSVMENFGKIHSMAAALYGHHSIWSSHHYSVEEKSYTFLYSCL